MTPPPEAQAKFDRLRARALRYVTDPHFLPGTIFDNPSKNSKRGQTTSIMNQRWPLDQPENPVARLLVDNVGHSLLKRHGAKRGAVLEVGSGGGAHGFLVRKAFPKATVVRSDLGEVNDDPSYRKADLHDLPFKPGSFDAVLSVHALEYARPDSLSQIFRVLAGGGHLVALVHHQNSAMPVGACFFASALFPLCRFLESSLGRVVPAIVKKPINFAGRLMRDIIQAAFVDKEHVQRDFLTAGFEVLTVETAYSPQRKNAQDVLWDVGYLVVAQKPKAALKGRSGARVG